jgi:predicted metal-dependent peptidase
MLNRKLDKVKSAVFLGSDAAFFAPLMASMKFNWSEDIETAATDGVSMWWNPSFFLEGPTKYKEPRFNEFVLRHELWHPGRLHMLRRGNRDPMLWNYACDVRINNDLVRSGQSFGTFPAWYKPELDQNGIMSEEDIYDYLFANDFQPPPCPWGAADMIDDPDAHGKIVGNVVRAITNAKAEGKPGCIPGNIQMWVDQFLAPIVPWEQLLAQWFNDMLDYDKSWARPNRRYQDIYLPSNIEDDGRLDHILYFQDVSGSINDQEIQRTCSELFYLWETFKPRKMTVLQFDTIIQEETVLNDGDPFPGVEIRGRGGTCLEAVRERIIAENPTGVIIFSDMQVYPMEPLPFDIPVLWIASGGGGHTPDFGKLIRIKV